VLAASENVQNPNPSSVVVHHTHLNLNLMVRGTVAINEVVVSCIEEVEQTINFLSSDTKDCQKVAFHILSFTHISWVNSYFDMVGWHQNINPFAFN